jgi:two-component system, OmpR family, sensor histidine kinase ArlS
MKNNLMEALRQLLIKVVLPFRRKKEEWLGNFRFSIAFRISLHYLKLLLINGAIFMFVFIILFFSAEWVNSNKKADFIIENIKEIIQNDDNELRQNDKNELIKNDNNELIRDDDKKYIIDKVLLDMDALYQEKINPYYIDGITLKILDKTLNEIIYNDINLDIINSKKLFDHIYYEKGLINLRTHIILFEEKEITVNGKKYHIFFQYDLSETKEKLQWLLMAMTILYLLLVYIIIRQGKKSDQKLLQPLQDMSATANRLTVNNLHSQRLNVEGTKNELKDLANVINSMLDRIEISYESQKQFVSDASHELRTPIAVIQGYGNLLNRWGTKDEEVLLESIEAINNEAKSMQDLVEKLLFLSRHDKKTLKLDKAKFNMCNVVEDMVKETRLVITNRNIESPVLQDVIVYGDKQALKQAIRVFIDNAVKYTKDGDTISISCVNDDGDCVISVSDTGIGMTKKDVDNIFERFYRSNQVRNEKIYGHGLGLSIAKLIVLGHTGRIKVRSQLTKGTTFTITLPWRFERKVDNKVEMKN